jgi:putative aldouronate transport system permease protein
MRFAVTEKRVAPKGMSFIQKVRKELGINGQLYLLSLPAILYFLVFCYFPMYGVQIAFKEFSPPLGITGSPWTGFSQFLRFVNSYQFSIVITNTIVLSLFSLVAGFPIPIILALLLNQMRQLRFKKFVQTITFAPHFISFPAMVGMLFIMLAPNTGILNRVIGYLVGKDVGVIMGSSSAFSSIYVWSGIWQHMGWEAIIYIAVLASVNPELYQAAEIDGAGKLRKILSIDIPAVMPAAITLLILNSGRILSIGFEKIFLMQNSMNIGVSEVIATYVYKVGLVGADYSYSAAIGLFNSAINLVILVAVNRIARKTSDVSLW